MSVDRKLPQPASRHALSILKFPDRATNWVVVMVASLIEPMDDAMLSERVASLHQAVPMVGARLRDLVWCPGEAPVPVIVDGDPLEDGRLDAPFSLEEDGPLRVISASGGGRLALAAHHAAFDGLALTSLLAALVGGPIPSPVTSPPPGPPVSKLPALKRLARPADRIAPSRTIPKRDSYVSAELPEISSPVTARLAEACAKAARFHNAEFNCRWRRVGITIAKGGPIGVGNVASYRRIDLRAGADVIAPIVTALASPDEPSEQTSAGLSLVLARPIVYRMSDSFLVSNLGRQTIPGVSSVEFFPVARGRSAVAFGAMTVAGGRSTLAIRARDVNPADATALLQRTIESLRDPSGGYVV
jgi:hypothetical protein